MEAGLENLLLSDNSKTKQLHMMPHTSSWYQDKWMKANFGNISLFGFIVNVDQPNNFILKL